MKRKIVAALVLGALGCVFADPYLETSGTQAVNTGYYPGPTTKVVVDWEYTAARRL